MKTDILQIHKNCLDFLLDWQQNMMIFILSHERLTIRRGLNRECISVEMMIIWF